MSSKLGKFEERAEEAAITRTLNAFRSSIEAEQRALSDMIKITNSQVTK
jgi:hypothetical protein